MTIWKRIKESKPKSVDVEVDGESLHIRGMTRAEKNALVAGCTIKNKLDNDLLEAKVLAFCVCDPETKEPIQIDHREWDDVPAAFAGPLVNACIPLCGFDDSELTRKQEKKSDTTGS